MRPEKGVLPVTYWTVASDLGCAYRPVDGEELFEDGFELVEVEGVGSVGFGLGGIVVDLEKDAIDSGSHSGPGEDGNELRLASADSVGR